MPAAATTVGPAEHGRPTVDRRRDGLAERHGDAVEVEPPPQQFGHVLLVFGLGQSLSLRREAEDPLRVVLAADHHVDVRQQRRQRPARLLHAPELAAVVAVATDGDAQPSGGRHAGGQAPRRPRCPSAGAVPEKWNQSLPARIASQSRSPGRSWRMLLRRPIVDHLGRTLRRAGLHVEQSQPVAAANDVVGVARRTAAAC